eukprot:GHVS01042602.1.p1 GENE.GHVS01042602.1~~GHVS01042602.1.p1  ORF type:complete len:170 (+),score=15.57 GHVS01042602.1:847-1356(+)
MSGLFGTAVATMGMLCTAVFVLAMSSCGPIADNAGEDVRSFDVMPELWDLVESNGVSPGCVFCVVAPVPLPSCVLELPDHDQSATFVFPPVFIQLVLPPIHLFLSHPEDHLANVTAHKLVERVFHHPCFSLPGFFTRNGELPHYLLNVKVAFMRAHEHRELILELPHFT